MFNTCALNPPSKKRARSGYSSSQKYTLERSLLTCLNSYYRQHANLGEALNTMISDSMETFNALLRLQKCADQSERLERLQQIWRTTQEQFYPPTIQTIPLDELYFTSADLI